MVIEKNKIIEVEDSLLKNGFYIYKNLIDKNSFKQIQNFWIDYFKKKNNLNTQKVVWSPYLGEKNKLTFSDDDFQCMYRVYDFYWNKAINEETKKLVYDLGDFVNKYLIKNKNITNQINEEKLGLYCSVSFYPINRGYLYYHADKISELKLYHHIIPLTFRSKHYESGGLFIYDKKNNKIDIEELVDEGDVLFYDGSLKHGVETIKGSEEADIGRIQTFAIPTNFKLPNENIEVLNDLNPSFKKIFKYILQKLKS